MGPTRRWFHQGIEKKRNRKTNDVYKEVMHTNKNDDGVNGLEEKTRSVIAMRTWRK